MAIEGAYEKDGFVFIEFSDHAPVRLTWREALERCKAIQQMETAVKSGYREAGVQRAVEQVIASARDARKKEDPAWRPPASVSMYAPGRPGAKIIVP